MCSETNDECVHGFCSTSVEGTTLARPIRWANAERFEWGDDWHLAQERASKTTGGAYVEDNGRSGGPGGGEGGFWRESFQVLCGETGELPGESFSVSNILLHPSMRWLVA